MYQFALFPDSIPNELKTGDYWVCCDEKKVPMVALTRGSAAASSTDPETWRPYEDALAAFETARYAGVGRVIEQDGPYVGIDVDECRDPKTGNITARGWRIIERLDSYAEVSPSLTGVKMWVKAPKVKVAHVKPGLEVYPRGRYFTVTGQFLTQCPVSVEERTEELLSIITEEFPKPKRQRGRSHNRRAGVQVDLEKYLDEAEVEVLAVVDDHEAQAKCRILCPWANEHTSSIESGTYVGKYTSEALFFKCHHAHCGHREWRDFHRLFPIRGNVATSPLTRGTPGEVVVRLV